MLIFILIFLVIFLGFSVEVLTRNQKTKEPCKLHVWPINTSLRPDQPFVCTICGYDPMKD